MKEKEKNTNKPWLMLRKPREIRKRPRKKPRKNKRSSKKPKKKKLKIR
jgi:hypothetical protein